jgi:protein kinase-like protein
MNGWRVPGYTVEQLLGFGGSGQVWRARVAATGEAVALKRITIGQPAQIRAAQAEAALLSTLDHPHLIRVHKLVPTGDAVVLVLDLAAGGTLADLVAARGRITPGEAVTALSPIGAALAYAHNAGVVHGDVTPANVLFTEVGMPLLADLGVARLLGDDAPAHSTPAFIDPAVAVGHVPGPQSDVFMLGATTLHALTGRPLWSGAGPGEVLAAAARADIDAIERRVAELDVPEPMREVVARALSVRPEARGTAAEFALDLRHAATPVAVELDAGRARARPVLPPGAEAPGPAEDAEPPAAPASTPIVSATPWAAVTPEAAAMAPPADTTPAAGLAAPVAGALAQPMAAAAATPAATATAMAFPAAMGVATATATPAVAATAAPLVATPADPARPPFDRSGDPGPDPVPALLTHVVRPRPRPLPYPRGRRAWWLPPGLAGARWAALVVALAIATVAAVTWVALGNEGASRAAPAASSTPPTSGVPIGQLPPVSASVPAAPPAPTGTATHGVLDAAAVSAVLSRLDQRRQRAFAKRDPALLTRVYVAGPLLSQDTALLRLIVPKGCGLMGVQISYADVRVITSTADQVTVDVNATLNDSLLSCGGTPKGRAPGSGPSRLRIALAWHGSDYLISAIGA